MNLERMKDALRRAVAHWNAQELDRYLELYATEIQLHGYAPEPMGRDAVRGFYQAFFNAFPKSQLVLDAMIAEGDLAMARFHLSLRHEGEFMGVPATGRQATLSGHTSFQFRGEQVIQRWSSADFLGLLIQLGALPAPG